MGNVDQPESDLPMKSRRRAFADRRDAGRQLARLLDSYRQGAPVVLALPRGGVPVAFEVARSLNASLHAFPTRKIGAPGQPELGIGAVAPGGTLMLNEQIVRELSISKEELDWSIERAMAELEAALALYWGDDDRPDLHGRVVILVDDGLATGSTASAALLSLRKQGVRHLALAVPICASQTAYSLSNLADSVLCVINTENLSAVGLWYDNFEQTSDPEVQRLLAEAERLYHKSDTASP